MKEGRDAAQGFDFKSELVLDDRVESLLLLKELAVLLSLAGFVILRSWLCG